MEKLTAAPREVQVILGGSVIYLICSFLDWQQVSVAGFTVGASEWHGIGVIAGLLALALLAWETAKLLSVNLNVGSQVDLSALTPERVSLGLPLLLGVFTVITFLDHSTARAWPEWLGLLTSLVIAGFALTRARADGMSISTGE